MVKLRNIIAILLLCASAGNALAQSDDSTVHDMKPTVILSDFTKRGVDFTVYKVKIIGSDRIEQQGAVTLNDILTNELNFRLSQDNVLGSSLSIQGLSGQNIKILIDGVPMIGRENGNINLSQINLSNIERIEIIDGPMSVIYGTDALGGIINLVTKKNFKDAANYSSQGYYESIGNYNYNGSFNTAFGSTFMGLSGGRNFFDGYSADETSRVKLWKPKRQYFGDFTLGKQYEKMSIRLKSSYFNELLVDKGDPRVDPNEAYAFDDYYTTVRYSNAIFGKYNFGDTANINFIAAQQFYGREKKFIRKNLVTLEEETPDAPDEQTHNQVSSFMSRATYSTSKMFAKLNYQVGYDFNNETANGDKFDSAETITDAAVFASLEYEAKPRLIFRPGLRLAHNSRYASPLTPSFNVKYHINSQLAIRGSYARGFRTPSLKELNLEFVDINHKIYGNKNLNPETSDNFDLAVTFKRNQVDKFVLTIQGGLFYNKMNNRIALARMEQDTSAYTYINIDKFETTGGAVNAEIRARRVKVGVGYSYTAYLNNASASFNTNKFSYTPEYRANATYVFKPKKLSMSIFYKYNGSLQTFSLDENRELKKSSIDAYSIFDATITKEFYNKRIILTAGAKNLLNVTNVNASNIQANPHATSGSMLVSVGRSYFVSLKVNLTKVKKEQD